jgi:Protein of unknown function (DUF1569)
VVNYAFQTGILRQHLYGGYGCRSDPLHLSLAGCLFPGGMPIFVQTNAMQTVFDSATREVLINRIEQLSQSSTAQWGKMNVYQMLRHCVRCEEMYLGKTVYPRAFIGKIFGRMALKSLLKDETPLKKNSPTNPAFTVAASSGDLAAEKAKWISLTREYEQLSNNNFEHWFFGKMTREQVGQFVYKHTDHHLRQFGV